MRNIYLLTTLAMLGISATLMAIGIRPQKAASPRPMPNTAVAQIDR